MDKMELKPTTCHGGNLNFYLTDHLGNNRVVANANGTVEQVNHYYPYGGLTGESTGGSVQPYKYNFSIERGKRKLACSSEREKNRQKVNGKELERTAGLDLYDYGARWMDSKIGARFTTIDPMCEKYYGISPYAYCAGNPVNLVDPDGRDSYYSLNGDFIRKDEKETDRIYIEYIMPLTKYSILTGDNYIQMYEHTPIEEMKLSANAYSNIFEHVLSTNYNFTTNNLVSEQIEVSVIDNGRLADKTNAAQKTTANALTIHYQGDNSGKFNVSANVIIDSNSHIDNRYLFSSESNIVNLLGVHEYNGHGIKNLRNYNHIQIYEDQFNHSSWSSTTTKFKEAMQESYKNLLTRIKR